MIVKKIPKLDQGRDFGSERARHVANLVDYMNSPHKASALGDYLVRYMQSEGIPARGIERLMHVGARGFVCEDMLSQRAEMMATAQAAVRSPNPIDHWILSWRENVRPTRHEIEETVEMFVEELGLVDHQLIWAAHGDTHNVHVHVAVNRYDAFAAKVVTVNKGFDIEAAHAAIARICDRFGWEPEKQARYEIVGGAVRMTEEAARRRADGERSLTSASSAREARSGHRSAQRIAQEDAWPVIQSALSWRDLHTQLARLGFSYERLGTNGAVLVVDGVKVNASDIHRKATISAISRRLAAIYKPRAPDIVVVPGRDDEALLAALRLAAVKFEGHISVKGSSSFRERVYKVAVTHGMTSILADTDMVLREQSRTRALERLKTGLSKSPAGERQSRQGRPPDNRMLALAGELRRDRLEDWRRTWRRDSAATSASSVTKEQNVSPYLNVDKISSR